MPNDNILDKLAELYAARDSTTLAKNALKDSILTAEIRQQLADIDAEFAPQFASIEEEIANAETIARYETVAVGQTQKGKYLMAVFTPGKTSWNTDALDGYAVDHPEILQFKRIGNPSAAIRKIAQK